MFNDFDPFPQYESVTPIKKGEENKFGSCRQFQTGLSDKNFTIDTSGNYCQCNLIDSSSTVKNPKGLRSKECAECEYSRQSECFPCGSEDFPKKCEYHYAWCQVLEELAQLREVMKLNNQNQIYSNNCDCICDGRQEEEEGLYCLKRYKL